MNNQRYQDFPGKTRENQIGKSVFQHHRVKTFNIQNFLRQANGCFSNFWDSQDYVPRSEGQIQLLIHFNCSGQRISAILVTISSPHPCLPDLSTVLLSKFVLSIQTCSSFQPNLFFFLYHCFHPLPKTYLSVNLLEDNSSSYLSHLPSHDF